MRAGTEPRLMQTEVEAHSRESVILHLRQLLPELKAQFGVEQLALFGSYARNEATAQSDVDLAVTFSKLPGLLDFCRLKHHLSDALALPVDLILAADLKPEIKAHVLRDLVEL